MVFGVVTMLIYVKGRRAKYKNGGFVRAFTARAWERRVALNQHFTFR